MKKLDTNKLNQRFYNKNYRSWSNQKVNSFWQEKEFRKFARYFKPGDEILDIGCAQGTRVPLFAGIGRKLRYFGIDFSRKLIEVARSRYPQLRFEFGDITNPRTLPRKQFAGYWASAVLMHIEEKRWPAMLANIEKIMAPGAIGYIAVPTARPGSRTYKENDRYFLLFDNRKFSSLIGPRGWKIITQGTRWSYTSNTEWLWYIVRLPKK